MIPTFEDGTTIGFSITNEDSDQDYLGVTSQIQNVKVAVELGNYELSKMVNIRSMRQFWSMKSTISSFQADMVIMKKFKTKST
ncbi:hypothetical protein DX927_15290 [Bacillus swezeyi]|uniref:Uncharacterized protein n=1 Tax=Bacillus swezeyi TaxID=1925020 RepID=A0A5M8RY15_9BACI|nr:hypothetical protein DX927_15290 [Bacillus swezeyi]